MIAILRTRWLLALGLTLAPLAALGVDDEIVKEFKKYFRKLDDTASRVEAVMALEGTESTAVVDALLPILDDDAPEVVRAAIRVLASFKSGPPVQKIWTELEEDDDEAVRVGLLRAIAEGGYDGGDEILAECLTDGSWEVRRRAVNALAASGPEQAATWIRPLCEDREPAVRSAALDALASMRSELVLDPALALLNDEVWQVRSSAISALGKVRHKRSIEPLLARMALEEGRLIQDIGEALAEITGRDFGQRLEGWKQFWETFGDRFEIPTDEQLRTLREKQKERREQYTPPGAVDFVGIQTPSRSILFVIDVSGSMEHHVVEHERFQDGDYPSMKRIDIVKTELQRTLEGLETYVNFNILAFATAVDPWKKTLVSANVLNKRSAHDWVGKLEAIGGASKEDLARAGLGGAANLEAGKTNTYGALSHALGLAGRGVKDKHYEVAVDTIFFLSDGRPSTGQFVDTHDILREINGANELRKVVIHTIAIGEFSRDFMEELARDNGGVFVDLGK